jgi:hypothetical protein
MHAHTHSKVKIGKHLSTEIKVNKGLRQGHAIALLLFDVVLEISIRRPKVQKREPYLTNVVDLLHMLIRRLLWDEDRKM